MAWRWGPSSDRFDARHAFLFASLAFTGGRVAQTPLPCPAQAAGGTPKRIDETRKIALGDENVSLEPDALMMRRDADFRLAVNRALARVDGGPALTEQHTTWFGRYGKPPPATMYLLRI